MANMQEFEDLSRSFDAEFRGAEVSLDLTHSGYFRPWHVELLLDECLNLLERAYDTRLDWASTAADAYRLLSDSLLTAGLLDAEAEVDEARSNHVKTGLAHVASAEQILSIGDPGTPASSSKIASRFGAFRFL